MLEKGSGLRNAKAAWLSPACDRPASRSCPGRYEECLAWARREGLVFADVGLDIEPDIRFYEQIAEHPCALPETLLPRLMDGMGPARVAHAYGELEEEIRRDGWAVENYQWRTDREVWMLYSSLLRRLGPCLIWDYGPEADAIAVGSTGGGPEIPGRPQVSALSLDDLARDLRLAARSTDRSGLRGQP